MYRSTRQVTTPRLPLELMCNRSRTKPLDRLQRCASSEQVSSEVTGAVIKSQRHYARNYNCRNRVKPFNVSVEDEFYVRDNVRSTKYEPIWTNPRTLSEKLNKTTVRLNDGNVRQSTDLVLAPKPQVPPQEEAPLQEPSPLFVAPPIHEPAEPAAILIPAPVSCFASSNAASSATL